MEALVSALIGTNDTPSETQSCQIAKRVSSLEVHQDQLAIEIQMTQKKLQHLMQQHRRLQDDIDAYNALRSPIRRVLPELLGQIFGHCLPEDPHAHFEPYYLKPPIVFTRVCSTWRNVALSSPRLWCSIVSSIPRTKAHDPEVLVDNTPESSLSLSRACPLSLILHDTSEWGSRNEDWLKIADLVGNHSPRWEHLELYQPDISLAVFRAAQGATPWLKSLDITASRWKYHNDDAMESLAEVLRSSPQLRDITWKSGWLDFHPSLLDTPWNQLTRLHLDCRIAMQDFEEFFPQLTNVVHCYLRRVWGESSRSAAARRNITLPCMKTLHLSSAINLTSIIDHTTLPSVVDLSVDHFVASRHNTPSQWPQSTFLSLFVPSSCGLRKLALHVQVPILESQLMEILKIVSPTLIELSLKDSVWVTDEVLLALDFAYSGQKVLCPILKRIQLLNCLCSSDGIFADMIESRWRTDCILKGGNMSRLDHVDVCIHSWSLSGGSTHHDMDVKRLLCMRSEGLDSIVDHYVS